MNNEGAEFNFELIIFGSLTVFSKTSTSNLSRGFGASDDTIFKFVHENTKDQNTFSVFYNTV